VNEWKTERELHWQDRVPRSLYLDEKRKVPVCVVYAPRQDMAETPIRPVVSIRPQESEEAFPLSPTCRDVSTSLLSDVSCATVTRSMR
jgi:hypothetical protein